MSIYTVKQNKDVAADVTPTHTAMHFGNTEAICSKITHLQCREQLLCDLVLAAEDMAINKGGIQDLPIVISTFSWDHLLHSKWPL
jgi:hypothetical protein